MGDGHQNVIFIVVQLCGRCVLLVSRRQRCREKNRWSAGDPYSCTYCNVINTNPLCKSVCNTCYSIQTNIHVGTYQNLTLTTHCDNMDNSETCKTEWTNKYPINSSFDCYINNETNEVTFDKPKSKGMKFYPTFLIIAGVLISISTCYYICDKCREDTVKITNSSHDP